MTSPPHTQVTTEGVNVKVLSQYVASRSDPDMAGLSKHLLWDTLGVLGAFSDEKRLRLS